jgi:DNA mismatch repair protein MutL
VHPTKIEVRFYNTNLIHSQILGCIREKLLSTNLDVHAKLPADQHRSKEIADAMAEFFKKHKPAHTQQHLDFRASGKLQTSSKEHSFNISHQHREQVNLLLQKKFIQIHNSFIIAESENGFVIVDQHALQERIIYEDLCKRIKEGKLESQKLLIPESFELSDARAEILNTNSHILEKLGIELVPFGPGSYAVQSFPTLLSKIPPVDFITDLIDLLDKNQASVEPESLIDKILEMAACKAAIKAGQRLSDPEIEQLLSDKQILENQSRCPHGRPTTIKFSLTELEKQFKRT